MLCYVILCYVTCWLAWVSDNGFTLAFAMFLNFWWHCGQVHLLKTTILLTQTSKATIKVLYFSNDKMNPEGFFYYYSSSFVPNELINESVGLNTYTLFKLVFTFYFLLYKLPLSWNSCCYGIHPISAPFPLRQPRGTPYFVIHVHVDITLCFCVFLPKF